MFNSKQYILSLFFAIKLEKPKKISILNYGY